MNSYGVYQLGYGMLKMASKIQQLNLSNPTYMSRLTSRVVLIISDIYIIRCHKNCIAENYFKICFQNL